MTKQLNAIAILMNTITHRSIFSRAICLMAVGLSLLCCQNTMAQTDAELAKSYELIGEKWRVVPLRPGAIPKQVSDHRRQNKVASAAIRADRTTALNLLKSDGNVASITPYLEGYVFPSMMVNDELVVSKLGQARAKFIKDYFHRDVRAGARSNMITLTISNMRGAYTNAALHPGSRLNAVYLIGMLDDTPDNRIENQPPVPSKAAFTELRNIVTSKDAKIPTYLKVAAIAGIQRHIEIDRLVGGGQVGAADKQALSTQFKALINRQSNDDLSYWLKRRSMQMLGLIGNSATADIALNVIKSDAPLWLKLDAVEAINLLPMASFGAGKNLETSVAITEFVADEVENESKRIQDTVGSIVFHNMLQQNIDLLANPVDYQSDVKAGGGAMGGGMGMGGMGGGIGGRGGPDPGGMGMGMGGSPGGMGMGGMGQGPGGMGGRGPGGPGGMGMGMGGAMGMGGMGSKDESDKPQFELPGYHLNLIRRRIKSLAYISGQTLGGESGELGLAQHVADDGKKFVSNVVLDLQILLDESNVGINDLENPPKDLEFGEKAPGTATHELTELCKKMAKQLKTRISKIKGEPVAPKGAANPLAAPAATSNPLAGPGGGAAPKRGPGSTPAPGAAPVPGGTPIPGGTPVPGGAPAPGAPPAGGPPAKGG